MTTKLATIKPSECDQEELACLNEALSAENEDLRNRLATQKRKPTEMDVLRARLGLHVTSSATIYAIIAAAGMDHYNNYNNIGIWDHPYAAAMLLGLNAFSWVLTSVIRKFDTTSAEQKSDEDRSALR